MVVIDIREELLTFVGFPNPLHVHIMASLL